MAIFSTDTLIAMPAALVTFQQVMTPEYWQKVYATGDTGWDVLPPLVVMMVARLVVVCFILLAAWLASRILRRMIRRGFTSVARRSGREQRRLHTLEGLISSALTYLVYIIALIPVLFTIGLTWKALAALFATSSVVLVAIGLGSQKLVRDLVNGLFILGEGQFDVGDWVTIGAVTGRVEEMGLRVTRLRDDQGRLYIIANGDINQVFNASRGSLKLNIDFSLGRTAPLDESLAAIRAAAAEVLAAREIEVAEDGITLLLTGMDAAKVTVRLTIWAPQKQLGAIEDEIRRKVLAAQVAEKLALV
ncbi:MAG: mechanosensitive ion channel family protein [Armatimonadota bacterium]